METIGLDIASFVAILILFLIISTLIFGILSYFAFKVRNRSKDHESKTYDDALKELDDRFLFFETEASHLK